MKRVAIVSAARTAIGTFGGSLKDIHVVDLGALVIKEVIRRAGIQPEQVEEVIMGHVLTGGMGMNTARQAALRAGLPDTTPAFAVNKVCGSGLKSVALAAQAVNLGDAEIVVAGGMESMSTASYVLPSARWGGRMGHGQILDTMILDGLTCAMAQCHMGITAENVAAKYGISREEQDAFALESHTRVMKAQGAGRLREEIVPLEVERDGERVTFDRDEGVRPDTSIERLARLKPVFTGDGTVTAGNASQLSDGASALVVMREDAAEERGIAPLARVVDYAVGGVKPEDVMEAPIPTVRKLLGKTRLTIDDFDLVEHNEAYASASLAVSKALDIPREKLNVHGGAVALGHPIGCSGARIVTTLVHAMRTRGSDRGLATLCLGGGNGMAMVLERP